MKIHKSSLKHTKNRIKHVKLPSILENKEILNENPENVKKYEVI